MLGLPSTTFVGKAFAKKAFYDHLQVSGQIKDDFVHKIERIEMAHSIQPATTNIPAGSNVIEVAVLRIELRQREIPESVLKLIAERNARKILFVCTYGEEACLAVLLKKLVVGEWAPLEGLTLDLRSDDMDAFWDSLASQVAYGDKGLGAHAISADDASDENSRPARPMTVEERFALDQKIAALKEEIARLDARCRKERQISRKKQLFAQVRELRARLAELEKEAQV